MGHTRWRAMLIASLFASGRSRQTTLRESNGSTRVKPSRSRPNRYFLRVGYLSVQRLLRSLSLSQRFLIVAVIVIALAMALLGAWIGRSLQASVAEGVATTAADTIESLIEHQFKGMSLDDPLSSQDQARLEEIFTIANDFESARLLQIRITRSG